MRGFIKEIKVKYSFDLDLWENNTQIVFIIFDILNIRVRIGNEILTYCLSKGDFAPKNNKCTI